MRKITDTNMVKMTFKLKITGEQSVIANFADVRMVVDAIVISNPRLMKGVEIPVLRILKADIEYLDISMHYEPKGE